MNTGYEILRNAFVMIGSFLLAVIVIVLVSIALLYVVKSSFTPDKLASFLFG
jgi:hypothetical protein